MTDQIRELIERLDAMHISAPGIPSCSLCGEARAAIEKLEAALSRSCEDARNELRDCGYNALEARIEKLEEVDKWAQETAIPKLNEQEFRIEKLEAVVEAAKEFGAAGGLSLKLATALAALDDDGVIASRIAQGQRERKPR